MRYVTCDAMLYMTVHRLRNRFGREVQDLDFAVHDVSLAVEVWVTTAGDALNDIPALGQRMEDCSATKQTADSSPPEVAAAWSAMLETAGRRLSRAEGMVVRAATDGPASFDGVTTEAQLCARCQVRCQRLCCSDYLWCVKLFSLLLASCFHAEGTQISCRGCVCFRAIIKAIFAGDFRSLGGVADKQGSRGTGR